MTPPSPPVLQQLYRLNRSLYDYSRQLDGIFNSQQYKRCLANLQGDELTCLVDYLDKISRDSDPSGAVSRRCLSELGDICASKGVLPTSHALPPDILHISPEPYASGGYGDVYQGILHGSRVRVKRVRVPHPKYARAAEKAFCKGAITWKRLQHPNVINILGFTVTPLQIVSDWMPNGNLPDYVKKHPGVNVIGLLCDVANGLHYLHSHGVIHREIKGSNVLIDPSGHARITDFGLAKVTTRENFAMSPFQPEYSPRWAAPEVLREKRYSKASDIFSFAMLMAEVFHGSPPLGHLPGFNAALAIIGGKRPSRPTHPAVTERLWSFMQRCWDDDYNSRPEAAEVSEFLAVSNPQRKSTR